MSIGYSSHGVFCSLADILEVEQERGNRTTDDINNFLKKYPSKEYNKAIWVTKDPFLCFKMYALSSDYFNYEDNILKMKFHDWYYNIHAIDLSNMHLVCSDEQGGYLYCLN